MVGVRIDGRLRVKYRSDLGQHSMGDLMVLDVTTETGRKIRVVNLYDQQEKGRNTATRPARMVNWNNIMNDNAIVCGDFNSHSQRWDPNCHRKCQTPLSLTA
jgi:endonuclease/exonuclease/phosphatase family metal-dependent hydrolase